MIFYGSSAQKTDSIKLLEPCKNCGNKDTLTLQVYLQYAHIYWIPFFPMRTKGFTECSHCKQGLDEKQFSPETQAVFAEAKNKLKNPPAWSYVGSIVILIIVVLAILSTLLTPKSTYKSADSTPSPTKAERKAADVKRIKKTKVGDVYDIELGPNQYTQFKVAKVVQDTLVLFQPSKYEVEKYIDMVYIAMKDDAFTTDTLGISKRNLLEMLDEGQILNINLF